MVIGEVSFIRIFFFIFSSIQNKIAVSEKNFFFFFCLYQIWWKLRNEFNTNAWLYTPNLFRSIVFSILCSFFHLFTPVPSTVNYNNKGAISDEIHFKWNFIALSIFTSPDFHLINFSRVEAKIFYFVCHFHFIFVQSAQRHIYLTARQIIYSRVG